MEPPHPPPQAFLPAPAILPQLHALNRQRLCAEFSRHSSTSQRRFAFFQGGQAALRNETDHEELFRQESNFAYLFGVKEPGCYACLDLDSNKSTLLVPELSIDYAVVMGPIRTLESFRHEYQVEQVLFEKSLESLFPPGCIIYTLAGFNTDSGNTSVPPHHPGLSSHTVDRSSLLYDTIAELRTVKTALEIEFMAHVNRITCLAHAWVMRNTRPGMREFQQESLFAHFGLYCGQCRHTSYTSICGSGENCAVLHYGHAALPNAKTIAEGDMCLLDMGGELAFYGSDVTCSFPANGRFSADQRLVYQAVLDAQYQVMRALKPGVWYPDMHTLAYSVILKALAQGGLLQGTIEDMLACNLGAVFMPHGLGHFLGIDTHDVGGRPKGSPEFVLDGYKKLRLRRHLVQGNVLTVEPGVYFIDLLLDRALADPVQSRFLRRDRLAQFRGFGGVRIEDDVVITATGIRNLTRCPRTVGDIEAWMAGTITDLNEVECPWSKRY